MISFAEAFLLLAYDLPTYIHYSFLMGDLSAKNMFLIS